MFKLCVSEFIGTFILLLTVGSNIFGAGSAMALLFAPLSIAASLMVSIYMLGPVSGGHFNPAVTLSIWISTLDGWTGSEGATKAVMYMCSQFLGGMSGALTAKAMFDEKVTVMPGKGFDWMQAPVAEMLFTFMLCLTVLRAAVSSQNPASNEYFGLAIGATVVAGAYAIGPISGACLNPAVTAGLNTTDISSDAAWATFAYIAAQMIGAALAALTNYFLDKRDDATITVPAKGKLILGEFVGTAMLVLTVGCAGALGSQGTKVGAAFCLLAMIYSMAQVSGGHLNPSVTLALVGSNKCALSSVPLYLCGQLLGGLTGASMAAYLVGGGAKGAGVPPLVFAKAEDATWLGAFMADTFFTFLLCFVVLNVACLSQGQTMGESGSSKQIYALAIGFTVLASAGFAIMNPAVLWGINTVSWAKTGHYGHPLHATAFELLGAGMAAGAFRFFRPEETMAQKQI